MHPDNRKCAFQLAICTWDKTLSKQCPTKYILGFQVFSPVHHQFFLFVLFCYGRIRSGNRPANHLHKNRIVFTVKWYVIDRERLQTFFWQHIHHLVFCLLRPAPKALFSSISHRFGFDFDRYYRTVNNFDGVTIFAQEKKIINC